MTIFLWQEKGSCQSYWITMSGHAVGRLSGDSAGEQLLFIRITEAALSVQLNVTVFFMNTASVYSGLVNRHSAGVNASLQNSKHVRSQPQAPPHRSPSSSSTSAGVGRQHLAARKWQQTAKAFMRGTLKGFLLCVRAVKRNVSERRKKQGSNKRAY